MLRAAGAAIGVVALIAAAVMTGSASDARSRIGTVGDTDAPSVRATEDFLFQLQDMDAQLLNALLVNGDTSVHVPRAKSEALYDRDRRVADGDLQDATAALAGDQDALSRLHAVVDTFGQYEAQAARTLADDERDGGTAVGQAPPTVLVDYLAGHSILFGADGQGGLMQAASDLEKRSADAIDSAASATADSLSMLIAGFVLFGLVLLAGLAGLQFFLLRGFHRVLNPALAAATLVALIFTIGGATAAAGSTADFHTAKSDAFDSVLALSQAKELSSGANADESRWLLVHEDAGRQRQFEASFLAGSRKVAGVTNSGIASYASAVNAEAGAASAATLPLTALTPDSAFGREFRNITFPGEALKAYAAFADYNVYIQDDVRLRAFDLTDPHDLKAAIDFDTNAETPGTSDRGFNDYAKALDQVIGLNEDQFDSSLPAARDGIGTWTWLPYVLSLLIIGLTVLGVRPRLSEYR